MSVERAYNTTLKHQIVQRELESGIGRGQFTTSGGTKSRPFEDETWWHTNGVEHVKRWIKWRQESGYHIWTSPDGRQGIELDLQDVSLGDGINVRCIIDRVMIDTNGVVGIVDLKTGNSLPESALQLGVGACAVEAVYGVRPDWGMYFKTRGIRYTPKQVPLRRFTLPLVRNMLGEFAKIRSIEAFPPHLTKLCDWCPVKDACAAYGGQDAWLYDKLHPEYTPIGESVLDVS